MLGMGHQLWSSQVAVSKHTILGCVRASHQSMHTVDASSSPTATQGWVKAMLLLIQTGARVLMAAVHLQPVLQAIVNGLRQSVKDFQSTVAGVTPQDVLELILVTQYYQMLREVRLAGTWQQCNVLCLISHAVAGLRSKSICAHAFAEGIADHRLQSCEGVVFSTARAQLRAPLQLATSIATHRGTCELHRLVPAGWCTAEDQHSLHAFWGGQRSWWSAGSQECYDGGLCCSANEQSIDTQRLHLLAGSSLKVPRC